MIKIGQPSVVGEITAGILLGPSLLGLLFPEFSTFLFPEDSLRRLYVLSQVGLILFMFIIGMELDISVLRKKAQSAIIISHASIIFPYFLGVTLAYFLYSTYAPENIPFNAFALFMGIAMSITAFPVLARIVQERNLAHTPIGTIIITCAAADDITAWCLLALVVAIVSAGGMISAVGSIVLSVVYVLFMWFAVRPILHRMAIKYDTPESINKTVVAVIFGILLLSSYLTEIIGIHALFGAFFAGIIMPPQKVFKRILSEKIEDISLILFLPLFFVFTGLRTQIGLLNQPHLWNVFFLIIGVAVLGKFVGSAVAAKFVGQSWRDSLLIGILMNTRGLMELVVLNIGYDLGVLSAEIFTMMVLMALATTFMAGPAIHLVERFFKPEETLIKQETKEGLYALISFGSPQSGSRLLELVHYLNFTDPKTPSITAAHFSPSADISILEAEQHEQEAFSPIEHTAKQFNIHLNKIFKVTDNVEKEVIQTNKRINFDIMLLGGSRPLFTDDKIGGRVRYLIQHIDPAVGVFIDKGFKKIDNLLILLSQPKDAFLLKYTKRFLYNPQNKLSIAAQSESVLSESEVLKFIDMDIDQRISFLGFMPNAPKDSYQSYDLAVISLEFWEGLRLQKTTWLNLFPSILIINK